MKLLWFSSVILTLTSASSILSQNKKSSFQFLNSRRNRRIFPYKVDRKCFHQYKVCDQETTFEEFAEMAESKYGEKVVRQDPYKKNSNMMWLMYKKCHEKLPDCRKHAKNCVCNLALQGYLGDIN